MSEGRVRAVATYLEKQLKISRHEAIMRARLMEPAELHQHMSWMCHGLSPSKRAVSKRTTKRLLAQHGLCVECKELANGYYCKQCSHRRSLRRSRK